MYEALESKRIGQTIKELRTERGMTETALAKELGISQSAITMYETGNRVPRDEIKIRMAVFFGRTVESIFYPKKQHNT